MITFGKNILKNNVVIDFIKKFVFLSSLVYLLCFAGESILPGIVIEIFNFNLLLFIIVGMMTFLIFSKDKSANIKVNLKNQKKILIALILIFIFTLFIVLYKVSLFETFIYTVLLLILMVQFRDIFTGSKKKNPNSQ